MGHEGPTLLEPTEVLRKLNWGYLEIYGGNEARCVGGGGASDKNCHRELFQAEPAV